MDEMSFSVAYALRARGIPLMLLTAYKRRDLPVDLSDEILIEKPFKAPLLAPSCCQSLTRLKQQLC
jgi:hypothetical protein